MRRLTRDPDRPDGNRQKWHRWRFLVAVLPAASLGFSGAILLPLWTEAVGGSSAISPETLLLIGSLELLASGLTSLCVGIFWLARPASALLKAGLWILALANLALALSLWAGVDDVLMIGFVRLIAGLGGGTALSAAMARIGRSPDAARFFLLNQFVIGLFSMLTFFVLPWLMNIARQFGPPPMAIFVLLGLIALATLSLAPIADVGDIREDKEHRRASRSIGLSAWLGLGMLFCFMTGFTTIYASWGRLGVYIGLDISQLSTSLALGALVGLAGLGMMTMASRRVGLLAPMALCLVLLVASAFASTHASLLPLMYQRAALQIAICADQVGSLIISPLLMAILALRDPTGRAVAIAPLATMTASVAGALLAALVNRHGGAVAIGWSANLLYGGGLVLLWLIWRRSMSAAPRPQPATCA